MNDNYYRIWKLALAYLDTRQNEVHTAISLSLAWELLRSETGQEGIVIPAIILHDVGWKKIPEELQVSAFGPKATAPHLNRRHEEEGVRIAGDLLKAVDYPREKVAEILDIIAGHDSRSKAISANDMIVKDADRLWRYTQTGLLIDIQRFQESYQEGLDRLRDNLDGWFFTRTAKLLAAEKIERRTGEGGR